MSGLAAVLEEAQRRGLIGPGPLESHIEHARTLAALIEAERGVPGRVLDVGSGGGLPGIVLAIVWSSAEVVLLDRRRRSERFLVHGTEALGLAGRVSVVGADAEVAAHDPELREQFDCVTARSVAPPPAALELSAAFAGVGGCVSISAGPDDVLWPAEACHALGLETPRTVRRDEVSLRLLVKSRSTPARFPRRSGVPAKRPLW